MPDMEKVEEWASDFKTYVDELDIARDDYRGIMEYIDDALALLLEQNETDVAIDPCKSCQEWECDGCEWLEHTKGR